MSQASIINLEMPQEVQEGKKENTNMASTIQVHQYYQSLYL